MHANVPVDEGRHRPRIDISELSYILHYELPVKEHEFIATGAQHACMPADTASVISLGKRTSHRLRSQSPNIAGFVYCQSTHQPLLISLTKLFTTNSKKSRQSRATDVTSLWLKVAARNVQ